MLAFWVVRPYVIFFSILAKRFIHFDFLRIFKKLAIVIKRSNEVKRLTHCFCFFFPQTNTSNKYVTTTMTGRYLVTHTVTETSYDQAWVVMSVTSTRHAVSCYWGWSAFAASFNNYISGVLFCLSLSLAIHLPLIGIYHVILSYIVFFPFSSSFVFLFPFPSSSAFPRLINLLLCLSIRVRQLLKLTGSACLSQCFLFPICLSVIPFLFPPPLCPFSPCLLVAASFC